MTCDKCIARSLFDDGPCKECQIKSASSKPYFGKEVKTKPAWLILYEMRFGGIE